MVYESDWLVCLAFPSSVGTWPRTRSLQIWLISYAEGSIAESVLWTLSLLGDFCFSIAHLYDS